MKRSLILLTTISILFHTSWFFNYSPLSFGDWPYFYKSTLWEFAHIPYIWTHTPFTFGGVDLLLSFYPFHTAMGLLAQVGVPYEISVRVLFLWIIAFFSLFSPYLLIRWIYKSEIAALVGAFVYSFNSYMLIRRTDQVNITVAMSLVPLALYFFISSIESKKIKTSVIAGLVAFTISFYEFRIFYILCFILLGYIIFHFFQLPNKKTRKELFKHLVIAAGLPLVLNSYWILPIIKLRSLTDNSLFERGLFGDSFLNIARALTLFHPFWTGSTPTQFKVQPIPVYFFLIPILAAIGLAVNRRHHLTLFFGLVTLAGVFFSKQVGDPFGNVYSFLYANFPGFNAFREASKFYFISALGYSVLIASLSVYVRKKSPFYFQMCLHILIIALFAINTVPLISRSLGGLLQPREIHPDYQRYASFIAHQKEYFRTFWLPDYSRYGYYDKLHPRISAQIFLLEWKQFLGVSNEDDRIQGNNLLAFFEKKNAHELMNAASIKYIVVPIRDIKNDDDFFEKYKLDRKKYIQHLRKVSYLKEISIGTSELVLFENASYKPHIYLTSPIQKPSKTNQYEIVTFKIKSPVEYQVDLAKHTKQITLQFSESYHPDWIITAENKRKVIYTHAKSTEGFNTFTISDKALKESQGKIIIYFSAQDYIYIGGLITLLIIVTSIFLWKITKAHGKK